MSIICSKIAVRRAICWFSDPVITNAKDLKRQLSSLVIYFTVCTSGGVRLTFGLSGGTLILLMKLNITQELPQHREMCSSCPWYILSWHWQPPLLLEQTNGWPLKSTKEKSITCIIRTTLSHCGRQARLAYQRLPSRSEWHQPQCQ